MIKSKNGITLVSLVITIAVMLIIASITINTSYDRFEINNSKKLQNDIELLNDKVSNYYLKYSALPIIRNSENTPITYNATELNFNKNANDNDTYYIIDLSALGDITLNYGQEGFNNPKNSDDVYIINQQSHHIYYIKGVELDGETFHTIYPNNNELADTIPPSKPEIRVISGTKNTNGIYTTDVQIEIIPGKDNLSGVESTTYSIKKDNTEIKTENILANTVYEIVENGTYQISVRTINYAGIVSEIIEEIERKKVQVKVGDYVQYNVTYTDVYDSTYKYTATNGWRIESFSDNGDGTYSNLEIISTGIPAKLYYCRKAEEGDSSWWETNRTSEFRAELTKYGEYNFYYQDKDYRAIYGTAGLYYNFGKIKFAASTESRGLGKGFFTSIVNNNTIYDHTNTSNDNEVMGENLFIASGTNTTVRTLTLPEINIALGVNDIDKYDIQLNDPLGIYMIGRGEYWIASPETNNLSENSICFVRNDSRIYSGHDTILGLRPLICFKSDIKLELASDGTYWIIK